MIANASDGIALGISVAALILSIAALAHAVWNDL